ncbi:MAG: type II toxin-antitoxin system RelE/ParE family toxin [Clostridia bacterium]|nr:type II toxin-antitoxin system RelE/ParE family toxin [Clostridia bacterium]
MERKYKLKIFPLAQADMEEIFKYIAIELCNPTAALRQIDDFEHAFNRVCNYPESCSYINNEYVKDKSIRKLVVNNYIAFYRA